MKVGQPCGGADGSVDGLAWAMAGATAVWYGAGEAIMRSAAVRSPRWNRYSDIVRRSVSPKNENDGMTDIGEYSRGARRWSTSHCMLRFRPMYERSGPVRSLPRIMGLSSA